MVRLRLYVKNEIFTVDSNYKSCVFQDNTFNIIKPKTVRFLNK